MQPETWPSVIDRCVEEVGAKTAALLSLDAVGGTNYRINVISALYRNELTEADIKYWVTELSQYDEIGHRYGMTLPAQTVFRDLDVNPDVKNLDSQPDYVFLLNKVGVRRKLAARLLDNNRYITTLGFQFSSEIDNVPDSAHRSMINLVPHVAKAVEMGILYERLQSTYSMVLSALDYVGLGLCIVDAKGRAIVVNKEAERIFDAGLGVHLAGRKIIQCSDGVASKALKEAIAHVLLAQGKRSTAAERIISIRHGVHDNPVLIEVSPLPDRLDEINVNEECALIQMIDINCQRHCSTFAFSHAYKLTAAEAEVSSLITEGMTNADIADARNTSIETVKSQIKSILRKARVSSRIELIRKILKTDPPVFGYNE